MKVMLSNEFLYADSIERRMSEEGDTIFRYNPLTASVNDEKDFDLVLDFARLQIPVETKPAEMVSFYYIRYFSREGVYSCQDILAFPLRYVLTDDQGPVCEAGMCARYVNPTERLTELFSDITPYLKDTGYKGFVSVGCNFNKDDVVRSWVFTGLPRIALFNIIEGIKGRLSDWFLQPSILSESWTTSLLLSKFPYPLLSTAEEKIILRGVTPGVRKHFWFCNGVSFPHQAVTSNSPAIGISAAWGSTLTESNRRALKTCLSIKFKHKQFRTDGARNTQKRWARVEELGLVE